METPYEGAGPGVVRADVPWGRPPVDDPVTDGAADNNQVFVHNRRRVELEVTTVDGPDQILAEVDDSVVPE